MRDLPLYPGQIRAVQARGRELLLAAEPRAGASYALRVAAILRAAMEEKIEVVIAAADDRTVREQHMEGPGGIWDLLREGPGLATGDVRWIPGGIARLKNGSTIQLTTWEAATRRSCDLLLLDDGDAIGLPLFQRLRERALSGPAKSELPKLVLVSRRPDEGWVREHWRGLNGDGGRAAMLAAELPAALRGRALELVHESFKDFIVRLLPRFIWYPHVELMVETAQRVIDGEIIRLLVSAPPRYFKSLIWARLLPAYFLSIRPWEWTCVISSGSTLAEIMSSDARAFYRDAGLAFRDDSKRKSLWRTLRGGGMYAGGTKGWAYGIGYNLGVVDDPFRRWQEAIKISVQEEVESFFWETFYGRRNIDGPLPAAIVVNHQALAYGDLRGRLLKREMDEKLPSEGWTVLNLPALARPRREPWPKTVTVIPDMTARAEGGGRRLRILGEPLCPELQDQDQAGLERLEKINAILFAAERQQDPFPDQGGGLFERWWWSFPCAREAVLAAWQTIEKKELSALILALMESGAIQVLEREGRAWDYAASLRGEGDATASCRGGITARRELLYTEAREYYYPASAIKSLIFETARQDGTGVEIILPQDPAAAGKILAVEWAEELRAEGYIAVIVSTSGSKRVRATGHAGAAMPLRDAEGNEDGRMGSCYILPDGWSKNPWNALFCDRHQAFDGVTKPLDLVDATSYLFNELITSSFLAGGGIG